MLVVSLQNFFLENTFDLKVKARRETKRLLPERSDIRPAPIPVLLA